MPTHELLLARIRGEYREMPGLRLTVAQASRLWHMDAATCHTLLERLVAERFLARTHDDAYVAFAVTRTTATRADLSNSWSRRADTAHTACRFD